MSAWNVKGSTRPVPWVAPLLYGAVLAGGLYFRAAGLAPGTGGSPGGIRTAGFAAGLALMCVLDGVERHRFPVRTPRRPAAVLLLTRLGLTAGVNAVDDSGLARALFVLLPFWACFAFGHRTALALAALCTGGLLTGYGVSAPGWYRDLERVSDVLMLGVGLVLAVSMAAVAAAEQEGRARLASYAARVGDLSAAAERNRLARDIHDSLGHHLTAASVQLELATEFRGLDPDAAQRAVEEARRSVKLALGDVRQSVRALREEPASPSLSAALAGLARGHGGRPLVTAEVEGDESGYGPAALTTLYRAAQEGLTNARRHARATRVSITVTLGTETARLVVVDDGRGFLPGSGDDIGFGLLGIRERARLVDGRVELDSTPGAGTRLTVTVPRTPVTGAAAP
ncbi:sensor histidine kinase [Streptomyces sp. NPDC090445]|uniref:sensor histidine kinase n=1 Tax=Streptomyces sp. NPDC090445 TaxID=3365963 RepID=UPI0037FED20E